MSNLFNRVVGSLQPLPSPPSNMPAGSIGIITKDNRVVIFSGFQSLLQTDLLQHGVTFPIKNIYVAPQTTLSLSSTPTMAVGTNIIIINGMPFSGNQPLLATKILTNKKIPLKNLFSMLKNLQHVIVNTASVNSQYAITENFIADNPSLSVTNLLIIIMIIILLIYACKNH